MWVLTCLSRAIWHEGNAQEECQTAEILPNRLSVGSIWRVPMWRRRSSEVPCGQICRPRIEHCSRHKEARSLESRSRVFPLAWRHDWSLKSSGCWCSDASAVPSPCLLTPAGAAVHSTPVATTAQRVGEQGRWSAGVFLWRAQRPGCAEKQGRVSQRMSVSLIWTFLLKEGWMTGKLKSSQTAFHSSMAPNSQLMPPWSRQSGEMGLPADVAQNTTELLWSKQGATKKPHTQSCAKCAAGRVWWFWGVRSAAGGQRKRGSS